LKPIDIAIVLVLWLLLAIPVLISAYRREKRLK
jgi:hypothetical protein